MSDSLDPRHGICEGSVQIFNSEQVAKRLSDLPGWRLEKEVLKREFVFPRSRDAGEFVNSVATLSNEHNHHPSLVWEKRRVEITVWTRQLQGLTEYDFRLAAAINALEGVKG